MGVKFFTTPKDVTSAKTTQLWDTVDLSAYVTAGTQAVLMRLRNDTTAEVYYVGARHPDVTKDLRFMLGAANGTADAVADIWVGLDASLQVELYGNATNVSYEILAEVASGWNQLTEPTYVSGISGAGWQTVTDPTAAPAGAALVLLFKNTDIANNWLGARSTGQTALNRRVKAGGTSSIVVPDGSNEIEIYSDGVDWGEGEGSGVDLYVVGYFDSGVYQATEPAVAWTLSTSSSSWGDATTTASGYEGAHFYATSANGDSQGSAEGGFRPDGASDHWMFMFRPQYNHIEAYSGASGAGVIENWYDGSWPRVDTAYEVGLFIASALQLDGEAEDTVSFTEETYHSAFPPVFDSVLASMQFSSSVDRSKIAPASAEASLTLSEAANVLVSYGLVDTVGVGTQIGTQAVLAAVATSSLEAQDKISLAYYAMVADAVQHTVSSSGTPGVSAVLAEILEISDTAAARQVLSVAAEVALSLIVSLERSLEAGVIDEIALSATAQNLVAGYRQLASALALSADVTETRKALLSVESTLDLQDAPAVLQALQAGLADEITFTLLDLSQDSYLGYAMNLHNFAVTEYSNYHFNSMATLDGRHYGVNGDGLFELTGASDAGDGINPVLTLPALTFQNGAQVRVPDVFLGASADGGIVMKVRVDDKTEAWYNVVDHQGQALHTHRVKTGKGLRGRYWQFEFVSEGAERFDIDSIQLFPVQLTRRF